MKLKIFSLIVVFLVSLGSFIVIVFNSNPGQGETQIFAFFLFIFLLISSLFSLIYIAVKKYISNTKFEFNVVLRRSLLIAFLVTGVLVLKGLNIFNLISIFSYLLVLFLIELYFSLRRNNE